jgi:hypothetical protein
MPHVCLTYASKNYEMRKKQDYQKRGIMVALKKCKNIRGVERERKIHPRPPLLL